MIDLQIERPIPIPWALVVKLGRNSRTSLAWQRPANQPRNVHFVPIADIRNTCPASEHDPDAYNEGEVTKKLKGVSRGEIQRASGGRPSPRKKRTRPEPRQHNLVDLERARDRVEAAYRRVENDRTNNPSRARAGLERARLDLYAIESDLRRRGIIE
jgi:hypothetical protein